MTLNNAAFQPNKFDQAAEQIHSVDTTIFAMYNDLLKEFTSLKQKYEKMEAENSMLKEELVTCPLTRVYNRRFLMEKVSTDDYVCVIDVDCFKGVNDNYGHLVGDKVLIELGRLLKENLRKGEDPIRYGGDEFMVALKGVASMEEATIVKERLQQIIPYIMVQDDKGKEVQVGISIGVAKNFKEADDAMYEDKQVRKEKFNLESQNNIGELYNQIRKTRHLKVIDGGIDAIIN